MGAAMSQPGDMHPVEDGWNQNASFLPMKGPFLPEGSERTLPCIAINGVQVYAYFCNGRLTVSVDTETASAEVVSADRQVPVAFRVDGAEVWLEGESPYPTIDLGEKRRYYEEN
jgi:hypothetical protein